MRVLFNYFKSTLTYLHPSFNNFIEHVGTEICYLEGTMQSNV
jgi:hypothetical protein